VHTVGNQIIERFACTAHSAKKRQGSVGSRRCAARRPKTRAPHRRIRLRVEWWLRQRAMIASPFRVIHGSSSQTSRRRRWMSRRKPRSSICSATCKRNANGDHAHYAQPGRNSRMADDVVVMYLGRVVEEGPVEDIFHNSKHPYTKALLHSIPSIESTPRVKLRRSVGPSTSVQSSVGLSFLSSL